MNQPAHLPLTKSHLTKCTDRSAVNTNQALAVIFVAASRLLLAIHSNIVRTLDKTKVTSKNTNHLLPAMAITLIGVQVKPTTTSASTGTPREWQISATWGFLESVKESQQNWFEVEHWPDLNRICCQHACRWWCKNKTYSEARAPATKAATTKKVFENIFFEIRKVRGMRRVGWWVTGLPPRLFIRFDPWTPSSIVAVPFSRTRNKYGACDGG